MILFSQHSLKILAFHSEYIILPPGIILPTYQVNLCRANQVSLELLEIYLSISIYLELSLETWICSILHYLIQFWNVGSFLCLTECKPTSLGTKTKSFPTLYRSSATIRQKYQDSLMQIQQKKKLELVFFQSRLGIRIFMFQSLHLWQFLHLPLESYWINKKELDHPLI